MLRTSFAVLTLAILTVTPANAGMVLSVERMVNPVVAGAPYNNFASNAFTVDTAMNSGTLQNTWVSYALGLIPSGGEKVTTFDVTINTPLSATTGFSQRWTLDADDPPSVATPSSLSVSNGDSHLIVGGSIIFVQPLETKFNSGGPPIPADTATRDYGVGTSLRGAWGFTPTEQALQQDGVPVRFAYLVVPRGSEPNIVLTANVAASNTPQGYLFTSFNHPEFSLPCLACIIVQDKNLGSLLSGTVISEVLPTNFPNYPGFPYTLDSFVGPGGPVSGALVDPHSGQFTWNSANSVPGSYAATIRASAGLSTETGTLIFNIVIPEPATLSLLGLTVSCLGFIRRR